MRTTTPSAPTAAASAAKSTSGMSIGSSASPFSAVQVHLGAVRGVVPDDGDAAPARGAHRRLEVGERHQPAAVAGGEHDVVVGPGRAAPATLGKPSPIDW